MLPRTARVLKSADYRRIYKDGRKFAGPWFAAFYLRADPGAPARVGFTTPRALGPAVDRNRIRRRVREAVRLEWPALQAGWEIVVNPRRSALGADFGHLRGEVLRLFRQLGGGR